MRSSPPSAARCAGCTRDGRRSCLTSPVCGRRAATVGLVAISAITWLCGGCQRGFYRQRADREAYQIVRQYANHPHWPLERFTIQVDPASRMFDPFTPDYPPMPPDDPTAHRLMHFVDNRRGYPRWHANGDTSYVENPSWLAALPVDGDGVLRLNTDRAVRLALLHSPNYQEQLEELYLSALDVSFERFRFDHQFFGGYSAFFTADGRERAGSGGESRSTLELATFPESLRMTKMFTTGADLVVNLANSLVWQFSGPNTHDATTILDFTLVQPLLRGAGRDRVMERLTIAERTLLANVRAMERFRRGFYLEIVTGRDAGGGPSRRGGFFGGSGLEGFTGVGGGGFGRVGRSFAGGFAGGAGAPQAGGYMGLLQEQQNLRNQEANIAALQNSVTQLEAFFRAGRIDYFQVELARQALLNAQSRWLNAKATYQSSLDQFKRDLGMPPHIEIRIDDKLIDQFNLIDPQLVELQTGLTRLQDQMGNDVVELIGLLPGPQNEDPADWRQRWSTSIVPRLQRLQRYLDQVDAFRTALVQQHVPQARQDIARMRDSLQPRRESLRQLDQKLSDAKKSLVVDATGPDETLRRVAHAVEEAVDVDQLIELPNALTETLNALVDRLHQLAERTQIQRASIQTLLETATELDPGVLRQRLRGEVLSPVPNDVRLLAADMLELSLIQARARTESITLLPIHLDWRSALETARVNRRDWMNARAALVDSWRLVQFNADDLESQLDIVFSGDISNRGDNPLRLDDATGRLRAGVQFDAPITRLSERNTYRQALIEYQQARRNYYQFQDAIARSLRDTLRTIEVNQVNFELLRSAVTVSIAQVELARLRLQEPPRPEAEIVLGATTARDLVSALSDLLNAQNDFLSVWINYEVLRRGLDFDLGTMQLTPDGIWIDPGAIRSVEDLPGGVPYQPVNGSAPRRLPPEPLPLPDNPTPMGTST